MARKVLRRLAYVLVLAALLALAAVLYQSNGALERYLFSEPSHLNPMGAVQ